MERIDEQRYREVLRSSRYQAGQAEGGAMPSTATSSPSRASPTRKVASAPARRARSRRGREHAAPPACVPVDVTPPEAASGARAAIHCRPSAPLPSTRPHCVARFRYAGAAGPHDLTIREWIPTAVPPASGCALPGRVVDEWFADDQLPSNKLDAHTSSRRRVTGIALRPGDEIAVEGTPDASDPAAVDYIDTAPSDAAPATPAVR